MNRRIREPYVRWCVRCTPLATASGAIYTISIKGKHNDEFTTGNFAFRLHDLGSELPEKPLDKNYSGLLDAIYYDHINDNKRANFLYMNQIRKSNQDPRFIKLYEDFLERNPEFKEKAK